VTPAEQIQQLADHHGVTTDEIEAIVFDSDMVAKRILLDRLTAYWEELRLLTVPEDFPGNIPPQLNERFDVAYVACLDAGIPAEDVWRAVVQGRES
jgi:hypothetical protein